MTLPGTKQWWIVLVTFEKGLAETEILSDSVQGASGWMACLSTDGEDVRDEIESALRAEGLRLVEIADQRLLPSASYLKELDTHLANNVAAREKNKVVVWGTIHTYLADGEA
jgi:hypothetical protein